MHRRAITRLPVVQVAFTDETRQTVGLYHNENRRLMATVAAEDLFDEDGNRPNLDQLHVMERPGQ